jgi:ribosomal protein L37E
MITIREIVRKEIRMIFEAGNAHSKNHVVCNNCGWGWDIEKDDNNPYLCHNCGYDNQKKEFDYQALNLWKIQNGIK